jgi:hypothetical protein
MVAAETQSIGFGGISIVARATGMTRDTIRRGNQELLGTAGPQTGRIKEVRGRAKKTVDTDPTPCGRSCCTVSGDPSAAVSPSVTLGVLYFDRQDYTTSP